MSPDELPPIPEKLVEQVQSLRRVEPSDSLVARAMSGLTDRPKSPAMRANTRMPWKNQSSRRSMFVMMVPVTALTAIPLYFGIDYHFARLEENVVHMREHAVSLPESGHAWTALDLQTHHHADQPAVVHLDVPTHVRVRLPAGAAELTERHCTGARCIHRFTHQHGKDALRVAVGRPGRYDIHVRHESKKAAMREHFVIVASRD